MGLYPPPSLAPPARGRPCRAGTSRPGSATDRAGRGREISEGQARSLGDSAIRVAGIPAAAINFRPVRDFARTTGRLAQPDFIAEVLALFVEAVPSVARPRLSPEVRAQAAMPSRRAILANRRAFGP